MKKKLFQTVLAAFLTLTVVTTFTSCGDDGGDDVKSGGTTTGITGTWEASGGRVVVFTGNTFDYKVNGTTKYSGTFSTSGSTITFNESSLGTASGNFTLSGGSLVLSNHTWDSSVHGTYTKDDGGSAALSAPSGIRALASSSSMSIRVTWDSVEGAAEYIVYRASSAAGDYTAVSLTSSTSYTDTNVSGSSTYYYKIAAKNGDKTSEQSQAVSATAKSSTTTLTISNNSGASKSITIRYGGPMENGSVYKTATIAASRSETWTVSPGKYTIVYRSSSGTNYNAGITVNAGDTYTYTIR